MMDVDEFMHCIGERNQDKSTEEMRLVEVVGGRDHWVFMCITTLRSWSLSQFVDCKGEREEWICVVIIACLLHFSFFRDSILIIVYV